MRVQSDVQYVFHTQQYQHYQIGCYSRLLSTQHKVDCPRRGRQSMSRIKLKYGHQTPQELSFD